jgi:2-polyprenyl-3-methyl-5-hydroxy-6-metoxy-1,4-benzoquinol methylase
MKKAVINQKDWDLVLRELESEKIKLMSYDNTIIGNLGGIRGTRILDYGAGPGILAGVLKKLGADVEIFEVNDKILEAAAKRIGKENVFNDVKLLQQNHFDSIICNLVLCIVDEKEVKFIMQTICKLLAPDGFAFFGFCNPLIFEVKESHIDFRYPTGEPYEKNHSYKKIKKEGNYEIHELHRPIGWYETQLIKNGFTITNILFTPEYDYKGDHINDFIIFKCKRRI